MTMRIASTSDTQQEMEQAFKAGKKEHCPLPMGTELKRRSGSETRDDVMIFTSTTPETDEDTGRGEQGDGGTEHGPVVREVYVNGELQAADDPPPEISGEYDAAAYRRRVAEAREVFSDLDQVIGQDMTVPVSTILAALNEPNGVALAYWIARHPEFAEQLVRVNEVNPQAALVMAGQKARALSADDLAPWLTPKQFRKWRERR